VKSQGESVFLSVMIVFLGYWVYQSMILTSRKATEYDVGVNFFPLVLSVGMLVLVTYLLVKIIVTARKETHEADAPASVELAQDAKLRMLMKAGAFFGVLVIILAYIWLLRPLGFALSTLAFLMVMNICLARLTYGRFPSWRALIYRLVGFGVLSFGTPYIFRHVFRLVLP